MAKEDIDIDIGFDDEDFSFDDGGFSFDDGGFEPRRLDLHAILLAGERKNRTSFVLSREAAQISALMEDPPRDGERVEMISGRLGFSSMAVIDYVARRDPVELLSVATFNISKKRMRALESLHRRGLVRDARIVTSDVKAGRDRYCREACARMGWRFDEVKNHAKLILMRTEGGARHCVRTSSNLNENPRIETYTWDNDAEIYDFYSQLFDALRDMRG